MTTETVEKIRAALLESPYIGEVLEVSAGSDDEGQTFAGVRVTVANVPSIDALGPVVADFRGSVRGVIGEHACVYVEIAVDHENVETVSTEKIVIRGAN
ncbi:hypothetical protein GCM10011490_17270 [Pseudoclavibacter endophyticus]|uniref:Uncharacterized protein n=1 Tax=Pseudoclavibacter endophyticus TaxID=1778590 RepID=A0A6H9WDD7_9MICO|nr:hypothetical protein [Pseudoclavibacter endophyticus]KAB1648919.1 hypothetical protein F8O04_01030 [Pseudoclavibacter endophyticus]GGA67251.1 hypothetical protein GCM10011490_17270 [Pseudoclavibacter endophyticus]